MNAKYFATLTIIVLTTGLSQPSVSAQVGAYHNTPLLTLIFGNVFVQPSRLSPSQQIDLAPPPETGTPDGRRTPGGSRYVKKFYKNDTLHKRRRLNSESYLTVQNT
jgi:hypothetical protein